MAKLTTEREKIEKDIERLKKRIDGLNDQISLQANKIGNTNILIVIAREEKVLQAQIGRKKKALKNLEDLRRRMIEARDN
ncbi:hypothetical protein JXJ21_11995 [candidate division KSB1 bacterium]|nr:hypothetical protein [candidate division KSB1 bacterium]